MNHPALLTVTRSGRPEHTPEAEPVVICRDGGEVVMTLDDGEELRFDALELRRAVGEDAA